MVIGLECLLAAIDFSKQFIDACLFSEQKLHEQQHCLISADLALCLCFGRSTGRTTGASKLRCLKNIRPPSLPTSTLCSYVGTNDLSPSISMEAIAATAQDVAQRFEVS